MAKARSKIEALENMETACEEELATTQECLRSFVDEEPCHLNKAGQCTTASHGGIPGPCRVAEARELLGMPDNINDEYAQERAQVEVARSSRDTRTD